MIDGLTILVALLWTASFVARLVVGNAFQFASLDAAVLMVLGYWFVARHNGNQSTIGHDDEAREHKEDGGEQPKPHKIMGGYSLFISRYPIYS